MSTARLEILQMVADGQVSPEDGDRLLAALKDGDSRDSARLDSGSDGQGGQGWDRSGSSPGAGSVPNPKGRDGLRSATENLGRAFEDAAGAVRVAASEGMRAVHKVFDEHRPGTESVVLEENSFEIPPGSTLRIQPAVRLSMGGGSAGGSVVVHAVEGTSAHIARGSAVEVHRYEGEYVITWAKSALELQVPPTVATLIARGLGGNISIFGFGGELRIDALGGGVAVDGAESPFRISSVGGTVRVSGLGLTVGSSSITATGGDVQITVAPEASFEMRATASFGGGLELPRGATQVTGRTRHRGTCLFGQGAARLRVDTVAGWIRVRDPHETLNHPEDFAGPTEADPAELDTPPLPAVDSRQRRSPREVAGEEMGDYGFSSGGGARDEASGHRDEDRG